MQSTICYVCEKPFEWATNKPRVCCSIRCAGVMGTRAMAGAPKRQRLLADGEKWCPHCKEMKSVSSFHPHKTAASGYRSWCKSCESEESHANPYQRNERQKARLNEQRRNARATQWMTDPDRVRVMRRKQQLMTAYGLTLEAYSALFEAQEHRCAICQTHVTPSSSDVDHDHSTKEVRGILCHQCNAGLGFFKDDPERMRSAADYLERGVPLGSGYRNVTVLG